MNRLILIAIILITLTTTVNAATWKCTENKYTTDVLMTITMDHVLPSRATVNVNGATFKGHASMDGLNRRIDFGGEGFDYTIIITPKYYAAYYDFSKVSEGEKASRSDTYYCKQK